MDIRLPEGGGGAAAAEGVPFRRSRRRLMSIALVTLLALPAALAVVPALLFRMPEPKPIRLSSLQGQVSGTYLGASGDLYKLVPYADRLPSLPHNLAVTGSMPRILIRARQLDEMRAYRLMAWDGDREIGAARSVQDPHTLVLHPLAPLAAGYYYVRAARDSAEQSEDYFYFQVKAAGS